MVDTPADDVNDIVGDEGFHHYPEQHRTLNWANIGDSLSLDQGGGESSYLAVGGEGISLMAWDIKLVMGLVLFFRTRIHLVRSAHHPMIVLGPLPLHPHVSVTVIPATLNWERFMLWEGSSVLLHHVLLHLTVAVAALPRIVPHLSLSFGVK